MARGVRRDGLVTLWRHTDIQATTRPRAVTAGDVDAGAPTSRHRRRTENVTAASRLHSGLLIPSVRQWPGQNDRDPRKESRMRKLLVALLVFGSVSAAFGYDTNEAEVRWNGIAGVVTALNVDNPVGNIRN